MKQVLDNIISAMTILMKANPDFVNGDTTNRKIWKMHIMPAIQDIKNLRNALLTSTELHEIKKILVAYRSAIQVGEEVANDLGLNDEQTKISSASRVHLLVELISKIEEWEVQATILEMTRGGA